MIKYIGMVITAIGMILLLLTILSGRRQGIKEKADELNRIKREGYVTEHSARERGAGRITEGPKAMISSGVKVPPRRRALSKEAREVLEQVEKEKKAERKQAPIRTAAALPDDGTDIMERRPKKGEDTAPTGILERKPAREDPTGVLKRNSSKPEAADQTDIMPKRTGNETGILDRKKHRAKTDDAPTGILKRMGDDIDEAETGILIRGSKPGADDDAPTGILRRDTTSGEESTGTLNRYEKDTESTEILERRH